ncbi:MAG: YciI family protein [Candidatus Eremiobacterota bacterium]
MRLLLVLVLLLSPAASCEGDFKTYYFVLLVKGPHRDQDAAEVQRIQAGHLANIERLGQEGKLDLAGPFLDDGEWRGLFIFNVANEEEVRRLLETDPAISSGRLDYVIRPWMGRRGASLR